MYPCAAARVQRFEFFTGTYRRKSNRAARVRREILTHFRHITTSSRSPRSAWRRVRFRETTSHHRWMDVSVFAENYMHGSVKISAKPDDERSEYFATRSHSIRLLWSRYILGERERERSGNKNDTKEESSQQFSLRVYNVFHDLIINII